MGLGWSRFRIHCIMFCVRKRRLPSNITWQFLNQLRGDESFGGPGPQADDDITFASMIEEFNLKQDSSCTLSRLKQ